MLHSDVCPACGASRYKKTRVDITPIDDVEAARLHQAPSLGLLTPHQHAPDGRCERQDVSSLHACGSRTGLVVVLGERNLVQGWDDFFAQQLDRAHHHLRVHRPLIPVDV